jgi:transcriptional accessory protein Tex/SPT6
MRGERASSSTKDEKESRVLDRNWVNVKEQLPAEDHIVLVYDPQLLVGVAIAVFDGKNFFQFQEKTSPCS